jgi:hypothetical protein
MTKNKFLVSAVSLLIAGIGSASAASYDGSLYSDLQTSHQLTTGETRGAQGPIRSLDVQPAANDIYDSLNKYQAAQQFDKIDGERGAKGPIRSENDMAMERSRTEWKKLVGPFDGNAD